MEVPNFENIKEYFFVNDLPILNINKKDKVYFNKDFIISKHDDYYFVYYELTIINKKKQRRYYSGVTAYKYGEVEMYFRKKKLDKVTKILYKNKKKSIWKKVIELFV